MPFLLRLEAAINRLMDWLGALAAALLLLLVLVMAWNVVARYFFQASSIGMEELAWHFYAALFLLGIPFALRTRSHVRVDLLYEKWSPVTQAVVDLTGCVLFLLPFCAVVIWAGTHFTLAAWNLGATPDSLGEFFQQLLSTGIGERSQDPGGLLNRWIIKGVIPLSFFFLFVCGCGLLISQVNKLLTLSRAN